MQPLPRAKAQSLICAFSRAGNHEREHRCKTKECIAWEQRQVLEYKDHPEPLPEGRTVGDTMTFEKEGDTRYYYSNGVRDVKNIRKVTLITNDGGVCLRLREPTVIVNQGD